MNVNERIKKRRLELDLSADDVAKALGVSRATIYRYESNQIKKLPIDTLKPLAAVLHTTPAYLMGWEKSSDKNDGLHPPNITEDYTTFPVIGEVAAGYEHIAVEDWEGDTVDIPNTYLNGRKKGDFFVLRVKGDSMFPMYQEDDKVLILKQSTMDYSGQIGVVMYDDDKGTLKKVEYAMGEDWMRLVPVNPNHPIVKIENEDLEHCRILGIPKLMIREIVD